MIRRLAALTLMSLTVVLLPAATATADPYDPVIPTETQLVITTNGVNERVTVSVDVEALSQGTPRGTIDLAIAGGAGRAGALAADSAIWTATVNFRGRQITIPGPSLPRGTYVGTAEFTSSTPRYLPSDDTVTFRLGVDGDPDDPDGDDDDNLPGFLPNTGGPDLLWLILGLVLVGGGTGAVVYARRQHAAAAGAGAAA